MNAALDNTHASDTASASDTANPEAPRDRIYAVLLSRKASVEAALERLSKRLARKHLPPLAYEWGKPVTGKEHRYYREDPHGCSGVWSEVKRALDRAPALVQS